MKWTNKGHEFDEFGAYLCGIENIFVWGAGKFGKDFIDELDWLGISQDFEIKFVDSDPCKQNRPYCGYDVIAPDLFLNRFDDDKSIIIVAASNNNIPVILKNLFSNKKIIPYKNSFIHAYYKNRTSTVEKFLLPVLMIYKYSKLYLDRVSQIHTLRCNLNCRHCLNFIPFAVNQKDFSLEELQADVDIFFSKVDYIRMFDVNGGEIFLHKGFPDFLYYIKKYRKKIFELLTVTNGSIKPSERLLDAIKSSDCIVKVDNYSDSLPKVRGKYEQTIAALKDVGAKYFSFSPDQWIDMFPDRYNNYDMNEKQLIDFRDACWQSRCVNLYRGNLYGCAWNSFTFMNGMRKETENDYVSVASASKRELFEVFQGYSQKGYFDLCWSCAGHSAVNKHFVPVAAQMKHKQSV
jgi:hypothetical protein